MFVVRCLYITVYYIVHQNITHVMIDDYDSKKLFHIGTIDTRLVVLLTAVFFPNRHYYAKSMAIVSKESFRVHELVCGEEGVIKGGNGFSLESISSLVCLQKTDFAF